MPARPVVATLHSPQKLQRELADLQLVMRARNGDSKALESLVFTLGTGLSKLEADALKLYLEGESYETMAEHLGCDTKTIDNALQRVKRKVLSHQQSRQVLS